MKKVLMFLCLLIPFVGTFGAAAISGSSPAAIAYLRNTALTISGSFSTTTGNFNSNFADILPMYPDSTALDRTYWKLSGTSTLVAIPFQIYKAGAYTYPILAIGTTDTVTNNNVWLRNTKNNTATQNYEIKIASNANAFPNGTYVKNIRLRLWNNTTVAGWTSAKTSVTTDVTLSLTVSGNTMSLEIIGGPTIDFGEITTNESLPFQANIDSMQPYSLTMTSERNYRLEWYNPQTYQIDPISGEYVAYEVVINSKTYDSSNNPDNGKVANITTVTNPVSHQYPATITLKTVTAITGGDYKDTLTLTISAP